MCIAQQISSESLTISSVHLMAKICAVRVERSFGNQLLRYVFLDGSLLVVRGDQHCVVQPSSRASLDAYAEWLADARDNEELHLRLLALAA